MKPLPSAPLTDEDKAVNFEFAVARRGCCWIAALLCDSWGADRRDADLMLGAQTAPLCDCCHEQMSVMFYDGQQIDIRGTVVHLP